MYNTGSLFTTNVKVESESAVIEAVQETTHHKSRD